MSSGPRLPRESRVTLGLQLVVAMYVFAAMVVPLAHHDVVCHTKTPTHCVTCVIASSSDIPADASALSRLGLNDLGNAAVDSPSRIASSLHRAASGRAPPSCA